MMYFKFTLFFLIIFFSTSCVNLVERALKSTDKDFIISVADEQLTKKKYTEAIVLYEKVSPMLTNIEEIKNITFKTAQSNFAEKNFVTSAHQFNVYHTNYPSSPFAEEALFQSGISLFNLSPKYNLDNTRTDEAIKRFQIFANLYPNSTKITEVNDKIDELRSKLELKSFKSGMLYFKVENYKAAAVQLTNFLNDFPDTKNKDEALYYIFLSQYQVAIKSVEDKKIERIKDAIISYKNFVEYSKDSSKLLDVNKMHETLTKELNKINVN